jgi:cytochrome b561
MTSALRIAASPARVVSGEQATYAAFAVTLHWVTVALVLTQFALAETWGAFAKPTRHEMQMLHMSFGILLGVAVLARIIWRLMPGHQVKSAYSGLVGLSSKAVQYLLYALILVQFVLGFALRWSGGESMLFFGASIPPMIARTPRPTHHLISNLHNWVGWTIIIVAGAHAAAALFHHFVVKDQVLARMIPALRPRTARHH